MWFLRAMPQCCPALGAESTSSQEMQAAGSTFFDGSSEHLPPRPVLKAIDEHPPVEPLLSQIAVALTDADYSRRVGITTGISSPAPGTGSPSRWAFHFPN